MLILVRVSSGKSGLFQREAAPLLHAWSLPLVTDSLFISLPCRDIAGWRGASPPGEGELLKSGLIGLPDLGLSTFKNLS